jgi:hypothetical protein
MTTITGFKADHYGAYIEKDPQATLDYSIDWSDWLTANADVATSIWTVSSITGDPTPLHLNANSIAAVTNVTTVYIDAGSSGNTYTVTNKVTTTNSLIDERYFRIRVQNRSL